MFQSGMSNLTGSIFIGTSGWSYPDWRGTFYPAGLPQKSWFEFYSRQFSSVEINATFYHLPSLKTVHGWRDHVPPGFVFAIKGSRFITHIKKLAELGDAIRIFSRRMQPMRRQTGVVLWQLPPSLKRNSRLLDRFLRRLPKAFRHAVEFRNRSWLDEEIFDILRRRQIALVSVSSQRMPADFTVTTDITYVRFHGLIGGARHNYSRAELEAWAAHIHRQACSGNEVYAYFNNDANGCAPANAALFRQMVEAE